MANADVDYGESRQSAKIMLANANDATATGAMERADRYIGIAYAHIELAKLTRIARGRRPERTLPKPKEARGE